MTGAPLPAGADCVVMREDTIENNEAVRVLERAKTGANIRRRGSDVKKGERVFVAGTRVRAAQWAMLASLGCAQVEVFRRPRVGILTTGNELKRVDEKIKDGEIRDSNSFALRALVEECGARVEVQKTVSDSVSEVETVLHEMFATCNAIVSSGGVSMGDYDVIRDVLPQIAQLHFWKIAVKPGKPVMFATREDNARTIPIWGLPGNPVSVMVSFEQFVRPALLRIGGQNDTQRLAVQVRVLDAFSSPSGKVEYVRALVKNENGDWTARINGDQGSGRLSTMTNANALLIVPEDVVKVEVGDKLIAEITN
jgi:molybdopterin molybdotransferase